MGSDCVGGFFLFISQCSVVWDVIVLFTKQKSPPHPPPNVLPFLKVPKAHQPDLRMSTLLGSDRRWNVNGYFTAFYSLNYPAVPTPKLCNSCIAYFLNVNNCEVECMLLWLLLMLYGKPNIAAFLMSVWCRSNSQKYLNFLLLLKEGKSTKRTSFLHLWRSPLVYAHLPFHLTRCSSDTSSMRRPIVFHCSCLGRN